MRTRITPRMKTSKEDLYDYLRDYGPSAVDPIAEFEPFSWAEAILDFAEDHGFKSVRVALSELRKNLVENAKAGALCEAATVPPAHARAPNRG